MSDSATHDWQPCQRAYQQKEAELRRWQRLNLALAGILTLTLFGFLSSLYLRGRTLYAPENFEEPLLAEAHRLATPVGEAALKTLEEIKPAYRKEASLAAEALQPQLEEALRREALALAPALRRQATEDLRQALHRIRAQQGRLLAQLFPQLDDPQRRDEFRRRIEDELLKDVDQVVVEFQQKYGRDLQHLAGVLRHFRPNPYVQLSETDLARNFLHLWLLLLDRNLMHGPEDADG